MKKEVNSEKDDRVKSVIGKIEQNQAAESKATPAAQADTGVEKIHQKVPSTLTCFQQEMKKI